MAILISTGSRVVPYSAIFNSKYLLNRCRYSYSVFAFLINQPNSYRSQNSIIMNSMLFLELQVAKICVVCLIIILRQTFLLPRFQEIYETNSTKIVQHWNIVLWYLLYKLYFYTIHFPKYSNLVKLTSIYSYTYHHYESF